MRLPRILAIAAVAVFGVVPVAAFAGIFDAVA
jgi:hypothetical protein